MNYKPSGDRFIIDPIKESNKIGSIYVAPTAVDKLTQRAIIIAISEDMETNGMNWKPGDEVLTERFCGQAIPGGLIICGRDEIMAKIIREEA